MKAYRIKISHTVGTASSQDKQPENGPKIHYMRSHDCITIR